MEVRFTLHATHQLRERKIEKVWVLETIRAPDFVERNGKKHYAVKKLNGHVLKVVYIKETNIKIITLYFLK